MENFYQQIAIVITIIGGVMAILAQIGRGYGVEKENAVNIAKLQKDIQAQERANQVLKQETKTELDHIREDIHEVKSNQRDMRNVQTDMQKVQAEMAGDLKVIISKLK